MSEWNILSGFEEFRNTKAGKKLAENGKEGEPKLRFQKVEVRGRVDVRLTLNKALLRSMKDNGIITFKILFNESNKKVAIRYDNSSNAMTLANRRTRTNGDIVIQDKYITATMIPLFGTRDSISYKCKFIKEKLVYIFD